MPALCLLQLQIQISVFYSYTILMFNLCFNVSKQDWKIFVTFAFLIGKLMVCQAKPSLLEVFHTKSFSSLCSLDHEPSKQGTNCYNTCSCMQIYTYMYIHTDIRHCSCKALGRDTECFLIIEVFSWQGRVTFGQVQCICQLGLSFFQIQIKGKTCNLNCSQLTELQVVPFLQLQIQLNVSQYSRKKAEHGQYCSAKLDW